MNGMLVTFQKNVVSVIRLKETQVNRSDFPRMDISEILTERIGLLMKKLQK